MTNVDEFKSCYCSSSEFSTEDEDEDVIKKTFWKMNGKSHQIIPRPNASPGFWLCILMPLAFVTQYIGHLQIDCNPPHTYDILAIASTGMCVESLCFFMYIFLNTSLHLKLFISIIPGILTSCLFAYLLAESWLFSTVLGFFVTFCYQNLYINMMRSFPRSFTFGEASILVQGLTLFVINSILKLPPLFFRRPINEFDKLNAIMMCALMCLLISCLLLAKFKSLRQPSNFYILILVLVLAVTCLPITDPLPIMIIIQFILLDRLKINIILFYLLLVSLTFTTIWWQVNDTSKASTSVRKIFHILIVLVYMPGIAQQCSFLYIASGVALAIFTIIELWRIFNIPPFENILKNSFKAFADEKDAGILALTPFCLLIGCSLPMWITPCPCNCQSKGYDNIMLTSLSGVLSIGIGDTAASIIGSKFGRIKWPKTSRTLEGTVAFVVSILATLYCLEKFHYFHLTVFKCHAAIIATLITALVEAYTDQIDNIVLPLIFYSIVSIDEI